jgi:DNA-binding Lrp family transcriptional regulator
VEEGPVVTFIILFNVKKSKITEIAEQLAEIPEISEVYSVTGIYDLVAIVRTKTNDDVAELVTSRLGTIHGIKKTARVQSLFAA